MPWAELKRRFPRQAENRSLHRAVRSLERMGLVRMFELRRRRWVADCSPGFRNGSDQELIRLASAARRMLRTITAARGVQPLPPAEPPDETAVDTYCRADKLSE